ncbi:hypothetical protein VIMS_02489 [Mycobacterium marinum]|nr:hypothetical protein VIMS_02489 [Mycobacterium marinum]
MSTTTAIALYLAHCPECLCSRWLPSPEAVELWMRYHPHVGGIVRRRRYCPVCWRPVQPSRGDNIEGHWDSVGREVCPMSGEPFALAHVGRGPRRLVVQDGAA